MPNLDFYAVDSDLLLILEFVMGHAGCTPFESYSTPGEPLKRFRAPQEVLDQLSATPSHSLGLMLHSPQMGGQYRVRRFQLKTNSVQTWRETIEGWGLIQLELRGVTGRVLMPCHTNHNTEARARKWESTYPNFPPLAEWDFAQVSHISRQINTYIRKIAVVRFGARPILKGAQTLVGANDVSLG